MVLPIQLDDGQPIQPHDGHQRETRPLHAAMPIAVGVLPAQRMMPITLRSRCAQRDGHHGRRARCVDADVRRRT
jgi:hypothetical protein